LISSTLNIVYVGVILLSGTRESMAGDIPDVLLHIPELPIAQADPRQKAWSSGGGRRER